MLLQLPIKVRDRSELEFGGDLLLREATEAIRDEL
jgi:hypothetical protein